MTMDMPHIFAASRQSFGPASVPHAVAAKLQEAIADGVFATGAQLPSQRELSEQFGVSRASLREAVSMLATLGLVAIRPGLGVFVTRPEERAPLWRFSNAASARDVYEARLALEGTAAALATERASDLALGTIAGTVDDLAAAFQRQDLVAMSAADAAFHDLIVEAAANPLIASMHRSARELVVETQRAPMATRERLAETVAEHREVLAALLARNVKLASETMQRHIRGSARRLGLPL